MSFVMRRPDPARACACTLLMLPWFAAGPTAAELADVAEPVAPSAVTACSSWPGEPDPLPTVDDASRGRSTWARQRVGELTRLARILEPTNPIEAQRFWLHATCLDPDDPMLARQAERAEPPSVHRVLGQGRQSPFREGAGEANSIDAALLVAVTAPARSNDAAGAVETARAAPTPFADPESALADPESAPADPESALAEPESTRAEPAAPTPAPSPVQRDVAARSSEAVAETSTPSREELEDEAADAEPLRVAAVAPVTDRLLAAVDRNLDLVDSLVVQARFRAALDAIPDLRLAVGTLPEGDARTRRTARVEMLTGTIQIALGDEAAARRHFRAALDADPGLEIDDAQPPKVRRVFAAVKEEPS